MYDYIATKNADDNDIVAFCKHEIELLDKKKGSNEKASKEAQERAEKVYNALAEMTDFVTITELQNLTSDTEVANYTNQRISALIRKLGDRVIKTTTKGKSYFRVA